MAGDATQNNGSSLGIVRSAPVSY